MIQFRDEQFKVQEVIGSPPSVSEDWPHILAPIISALDLSATLLSIHFEADANATTLAEIGGPEYRLLASLLAERALMMADDGPCYADKAVDRAWIGSSVPEGRPLLSIVFRGARTRSKVVFTAAFAGSGAPDRRLTAAALKRLLPMLDAYLLLWQRHRHDEHCTAGLRNALNAIDLGFVLLDRDGTPCFVNAAADAFLHDGRLVKRRGSSIHASNLRDTLRLQSAVGAAIASNVDGAGSASTGNTDSAQLRLERDGEQLIVAALPAALRAHEPGSIAVILVMLRPDADPEKMAAPVCAIFGLSGVETRLACQLVNGRSLFEACEALRIREATGRGYLKQIFAKTNVNRQAELVRVLLSGIIRARSGGLIQVI